MENENTIVYVNPTIPQGLFIQHSPIKKGCCNRFNKLDNLMPTGTILFEGRIMSPNFKLVKGNVQPYSTVPAVLSLFDSSHNYLCI